MKIRPKLSDKERIKENARVRARVLKKRIYSNRVKTRYGCADCGYKHHASALHFDHINRTDKYETISRLISKDANLETIKSEMRKCEIRCANCHAVKTYSKQEHKASKIRTE